ncbi:MAG: hypothetical protein ACI4B3_09165 [Prevotella sp.]
MATIINLALRIYGGASECSLAKQPFVSVGNVPQKFHPMPPTLVGERQVWMIMKRRERLRTPAGYQVSASMPNPVLSNFA